jgi:hypothetical protein
MREAQMQFMQCTAAWYMLSATFFFGGWHSALQAFNYPSVKKEEKQ